MDLICDKVEENDERYETGEAIVLSLHMILQRLRLA